MDKRRLIKTTQELIQIPSISRNEGEVAKYLFSDLEAFGFSPKIDKIGNVIATIGKGSPSIMLNAHMDTVPPQSYKRDPYSGRKKGDKIFGIGASDCKASIASILELAKAFPKPNGKLILSFSICEEATLPGKYKKGSILIAKKAKADTCIVAEPTLDNNGRPYISAGSRGRSIFNFTVRGRGTHSSRPETGRNAIDFSVDLINRLKKLALKKKKFHDSHLNEVLSIIRIHADSKATNIIPDLCELLVDYRTLPGRRDAVRTIRKIYKKEHYRGSVKTLFSSPGYVLPRNSPTLKLIRTASQEIFNWLPETRVALGKADAEYFHRSGMETIIFGPGINHQCHQPDEFCSIKGQWRWTRCMEHVLENFFKAKQK